MLERHVSSVAGRRVSRADDAQSLRPPEPIQPHRSVAFPPWRAPASRRRVELLLPVRTLLAVLAGARARGRVRGDRRHVPHRVHRDLPRARLRVPGALRDGEDAHVAGARGDRHGHRERARCRRAHALAARPARRAACATSSRTFRRRSNNSASRTSSPGSATPAPRGTCRTVRSRSRSRFRTRSPACSASRGRSSASSSPASRSSSSASSCSATS